MTDDPFADLWYYCLAVIGYGGFGPLSLYDRAYAVRATARLAPDRAREAARLRRMLEADSSFEVVHFLPLYVLGQSPEAVLAAIDDAASAHPASPRTREAIAGQALVASLPSASQRTTLRALTRFASAEWRAVGRTLADDAAAHRRHRDAEQRFVRDGLQPALMPYLDAFGVHGMTIIVSPAVGAEGRFALGPMRTAVVVVAQGASDDSLTSALAAVRELAFPIVRTTLASSAEHPDRVTAERQADRAATRVGALLLEAALPEVADRYRQLYVPRGDAEAFATRFPVDSFTLVRLRRAIVAAAPAATPARH